MKVNIYQDANEDTFLVVGDTTYKVYFQEITETHMAGSSKPSVTATVFGFSI